MAINRRVKCLILTVLFLSGLSVLHAQTAGYFLDPDNGFIQRLTWSGGTYSLHCEVIIEKEEEIGEYTEYIRKFTTGNYLDISLPPGNYRFRVIPYDILGKPSKETQWAPFMVFNAVKPELYQPGEDLDYYNDNQGSKFEFNGKNIEPNAKVYFVNSKGEHIVPVEIIVDYDGSRVRVVFDKGKLVDGEYDVFVVNPCGLEASISGIDFKTYREKFGLFHYIINVSIMPGFHIYGESPVDYAGFSYYLLSMRASIISCIYLNSYFGQEFSFFKMSEFGLDDYYFPGAMNGYTFGYNVLFINWLNGRESAVTLRIGVGFSMQPVDLRYSNIGVSFTYRIYGKFYIEAGVDFPYSLHEGSSGYLLPWIGLSLIF